MGRLKQNFEDVGINLEDWLFYVQDLMDLKILVLQKAMSSYLLNNFICPVLLEAFLSCQGNQNVGEILCNIFDHQLRLMYSSPLDLNPTKLMSLEIDVLCSDEDNKKSRNPNVWKEDPSEHQLAIVGAALYYLLHVCDLCPFGSFNFIFGSDYQDFVLSYNASWSVVNPVSSYGSDWKVCRIAAIKS